MNNVLYFPRLATSHASQMLLEYSRLDIAELSQRASTVSEAAYWYQTAPTSQRADDEILAAFRTTVLEIAAMHGFPGQLTSKQASKTAFDRDLVSTIGRALPLQPVEASEEDVWNFITLVVAPDVALWRWPNGGEKGDYERIIGRPRNVFRRLWWRTYLLDVEESVCAHHLYEDEAVAILERTNVGFNPPIARSIARTHLARFAGKSRRTEALRDAMKRIRRLQAFIEFSALTGAEVDALVLEIFAQTEAALFGPWPAPDPTKVRRKPVSQD